MCFLYSRMEEMVTLQYGSFAILGEWAKEFTQRIGCSKRVANQTLQGQLYLNKLKREHPGWNTAQWQEWGLIWLEHLFHTMRRKGHERLFQSCSQVKGPETAKVMAPEHLSIRTLLGSTNAKILKVTEQVHWGEYMLAPSVLPHRWQEECIAELCFELACQMARAGLQSGPGLARPTSQRRCSHGHSPSWAQSSSAGSWGGRVCQRSKRRPFNRAIGIKKVMLPFQA